MLTGRESDDKMTSQKKALETAKQMLHQSRGESRSAEMDWDYYGTQARVQEQSIQGDRISSIEKDEEDEREVPKRAASTPLEEGGYSRNYTTFGLSAVEKKYSCENCQKRHKPPLCQCSNCRGPHLVSKCPFSGTPEGETIPKIE